LSFQKEQKMTCQIVSCWILHDSTCRNGIQILDISRHFCDNVDCWFQT